MSLFLDDGDVRLYHGDALTVLQTLEAESVHMCVTSPPFYGLRSYLDDEHEDKPLEIGLEPTPDEWVASLVAVFREVRRVLRPEGVLFVEVGDSYAHSTDRMPPQGGAIREPGVYGHGGGVTDVWSGATVKRSHGCKPKDLIGAPWALAFALRADGWYLRSDIVWSRPNPMPESVTDRPTKSHSYVFLLAKQPRYFFDQEAVREPVQPSTIQRVKNDFREYDWRDTQDRPTEAIARKAMGLRGGAAAETTRRAIETGRNVRSVWNIATQPYPEAHFATFPEELARRCILAGTSERGCCPECGAPWTREVLATGAENHRVREDVGDWIKHKGGNADGKRSLSGATYKRQREAGEWQSPCGHDGATPCVVLDPFVGSGTVPYVARLHGRHAIGIDLSESYLELAARRLQQLSLFA